MSFEKSSVNTGVISHERIEVTKSLASARQRTIRTGSSIGKNYQVTTSDSCPVSKNCHPECSPKVAPAFAGFHEGGADQTIIYYSNAPLRKEEDTFVPKGKYISLYSRTTSSMPEPSKPNKKKYWPLLNRSGGRADHDLDWRGQSQAQYYKVTSGHGKDMEARSEARFRDRKQQIRAEKKFDLRASRDLNWRGK